MIRAAGLCLVLWPGGAGAQVLSFPGNAELTIEIDAGLDSYDLPTAPWANGAVPTEAIEGTLTQQAWRIDANGLTTLQLLRPLREQLRNAGYDIVFTCQTEACGGFDFRFATPVLPPPEMQVNLGDFRFLSATKEDAAIALMVSRTASAGFVQITSIGPQDDTLARAEEPPLRAAGHSQNIANLADAMGQTGRFVLHGLAFETGSAQLGPGPFATLQDLADYLSDVPDLTVALVGHTDSSGSLEGNIALSKRRAGSVLERLVSDYGVDRQQLEAQGNGYLSPIASNQTEAGRDANRRVEVIVTSTQ